MGQSYRAWGSTSARREKVTTRSSSKAPEVKAQSETQKRSSCWLFLMSSVQTSRLVCKINTAVTAFLHILPVHDENRWFIAWYVLYTVFITIIITEDDYFSTGHRCTHQKCLAQQREGKHNRDLSDVIFSKFLYVFEWLSLQKNLKFFLVELTDWNCVFGAFFWSVIFPKQTKITFLFFYF